MRVCVCTRASTCAYVCARERVLALQPEESAIQAGVALLPLPATPHPRCTKLYRPNCACRQTRMCAIPTPVVVDEFGDIPQCRARLVLRACMRACVHARMHARVHIHAVCVSVLVCACVHARMCYVCARHHPVCTSIVIGKRRRIGRHNEHSRREHVRDPKFLLQPRVCFFQYELWTIVFPWFSVAVGPATENQGNTMVHNKLANTAARGGPATEDQGNMMVHNLY